MRRVTAGFTAIEMVLAIVIAGILMAIAFPFLRNTSQKTSARGAGDEISRLYATARAASISRGKVAWLVLDPAAGTVMVIAKQVNGTGIDTVAAPDNLTTRYKVTFTSSTDSLVFTPRGIGANLVTTTVILNSTTGGVVDTVLIYPTGMIVR
jgi:prepilin-type N-terminal cleavage/methylation domain-containing protein